MERWKTREEAPRDRGTRNLAKALALQGKMVSPHEVYDDRQPYCDEPVLVHREIRAGGMDKPLAVTTHRPCRRCEKCLQFRQMQWRERAMVEIERARRSWFITLTFSPVHLAGVIFESQNEKGSNELKRLDRAAYRHVQRYLKRIRKATKAEIRYLCVFERGEETGRAHYHALLHEVDKPVTKAVIESQWRSHVHCRLVASGRGAASYITKYATKSFDVAPRASVRYGKPVRKPETPDQSVSRSGT